mgnify:CR=1 FL=1
MWLKRMRSRRGQSIVEYAVLISAVAFGVWVVSGKVYRSFVAQAQQIEKQEYVF